MPAELREDGVGAGLEIISEPSRVVLTINKFYKTFEPVGPCGVRVLFSLLRDWMVQMGGGYGCEIEHPRMMYVVCALSFSAVAISAS